MGCLFDTLTCWLNPTYDANLLTDINILRSMQNPMARRVGYQSAACCMCWIFEKQEPGGTFVGMSKLSIRSRIG